MQIKEVLTKSDIKDFLDVARIIYRDDDIWVCPLDMEIEKIFNREKNVFFKNGEATRWVLYDDAGKPAGRVAAFINRKKAFNFQVPTGGMGFFECVNNKEAAFLLFNCCRKWLAQRGMEAMDGPVNFGENDNFWGLLVEGYTHPAYGMPYNKPYYKELFEEYGFKFYFEQVSNHLSLTKPFPERFWKIADWVRQKPGFSFKHFTFKDQELFIKDFKTVYDDAWQFHENFTPINEETLRDTISSAKDVIDEQFIWFAYHEDEPIAFLIMLPDINQILKHLNGKLSIIDMLKFLYYKKTKAITRARITIMGVAPKFQKSGVESAIFWHLQKVMDAKPHYTELELSWVGDFNPKMRALHESVGAVFGKRHYTYRCIFVDNVEMHRSTIIPKDTKEKVNKNN
jgi:hypothetical protein